MLRQFHSIYDPIVFQSTKLYKKKRQKTGYNGPNPLFLLIKSRIKPQLTFSLFLWLIHFWPLLPPSSDSILFGSHVFLSRMQTGMGLSVWRVFNTNYPSIIFPNWIRFCSSVKTASIPELGLLTPCMCTYAIFCIWRYWNPLFNPISSF